MRCPYCHYPESKVVDSRPTEENQSIRRRRECMSCGKRFTTYEKIEDLPMTVIKRDGSIEIYDRSKLMNGIIRACQKRPVPMAKIESIVEDVEKEIEANPNKEMKTSDIGEKVLNLMKDIDEVAYVRFASVYRDFKDLDTFMEELKKLQKSK